MTPSPARKGEKLSEEYAAWLDRLLRRTLANTDVLNGFQARFITDFNARFERFGAGTFVSVKQHNVLTDIEARLTENRL